MAGAQHGVLGSRCAEDPTLAHAEGTPAGPVFFFSSPNARPGLPRTHNVCEGNQPDRVVKCHQDVASDGIAQGGIPKHANCGRWQQVCEAGRSAATPQHGRRDGKGESGEVLLDK